MQRHSMCIAAIIRSSAIPKSLPYCWQASNPSRSIPDKQKWCSHGQLQNRAFGRSVIHLSNGSYTEAAKSLNQKGLEDEESKLTDTLAHEKERQNRAPWHREGSDMPRVARQRSAGAMVKGKLLTTPSRLLKLILPLITIDKNSDRKDIEPLALLIHPQQPLSYLERLIQSELPQIKTPKGEEKVPAIYFRAKDSEQDEIKPKFKTSDEEAKALEKEQQEDHDLEETYFARQTEKTGKLSRKKRDEAQNTPLGDGGVESFSGLGHEASSTEGQERRFVRWSSSTEIGDFIRDAAQGKEFAVEIEGAPEEIRVAVPSFNDRTHYLRMRLRKASTKLMDMASVKKECDVAAHQGAQRVAMAGAGLLVGYWYVVYRLTFETDLGWDTMEPVTYLIGLSTLICGYVYFLYNNREVSYRSALNLTISRRQTKLYQVKGFDIQRWESLIEEGNALRKEIKTIAQEYDVDWDETKDENDEKVTEALKQVRDEKKAKRGDGKKEDDEGG